jgi:transcriptional regulator with XRE-family HTH domain
VALAKPIERLRLSSYSKASTPLEQSFYGRFIAELVRLRKERSWTQEDMEHELGVAGGLVAKWETFQSLPGAFMLMCWCMKLEVQLTTTALKVRDATDQEDNTCQLPITDVETEMLRNAGLL